MASLSGLGGTSNNRGIDMANRYVDQYGEDYSAYVNRYEEEQKLKQLYEDKGTLDFQDMLQLMVAQFQNQTIDNQADTSDMMNQLVQMTTMQAMNEMVDHMEELRLANVMSYAASLVGREVTVGVWRDVEVLNDDGTITKMRKLEEIYGEVKGMGTYNGQQVIFVGDNYDMYYLSDILAVGEMPPKKEDGASKVEHAPNCTNDECQGECIVTREDGTKHAADCTDETCEGKCLERTEESDNDGDENENENENETTTEPTE